MHKKVHAAFETLEQQRIDLLATLRPLPKEVLIGSPPGKWPILHILSHLITGERTGFEYVRKKMLGIESAGNAGLYEDFKMVILVVSQRLPFLKYKAPRIIVERTVVFDDLTQLEEAWSKLRREWKDLLESIPDHHVDRKIFRHVVAGRLSIEQGIRFFGEHVIHHRPQIERLINRSRHDG